MGLQDQDSFDGSIEHYKIHLATKCFTQKYEIYHEETFILVAQIGYVALLVATASRSWGIFWMDVKNSFLNEDLSKEVYMQPPIDLSIASNKVCRLCCTLYRFKQASQAWLVKFRSTFSCLGYFASPYDSSLFIHLIDKGTILLLLHVDDINIISDDLSGIQEIEDFLI